MSGDQLRRMTVGETVGTGTDERPTHLVGSDHETPDSGGPELTDVLSSIDDPRDGDVTVDEGHVTESLDEILIAMIASSADETHGTGLMDELDRLFDVQLSPGTVYPRLHELESEDLLEMHELVQTKQYSIDDPSSARDRVERAVQQHLAIGLFLQASLDAL